MATSAKQSVKCSIVRRPVATPSRYDDDGFHSKHSKGKNKPKKPNN